MDPQDKPTAHLPWYRLPVLWLGIVIFAVSIAGCVWLIVVSVQYRDEALPDTTHAVLGVPVQRHPPPASS